MVPLRRYSGPTGDFPPVDLGDGFSVWMCHASGPRLPSLEGMRVVQVEFHAEAVPWLLDEAESVQCAWPGAVCEDQGPPFKPPALDLRNLSGYVGNPSERG